MEPRAFTALFRKTLALVVPLLVAYVFTSSAYAREPLPEWYREGATLCDTTVERNQKRHWIYEAKIDGSGVRQLTGTLEDPMERVDNRKTVVIEDWDPCYLPDGGFAFVSTRSQSYGRCHGGRYVPSFMLYRMNGDGSGIRRLSFGEANEWDPAVLPDGRIVYTRWDYINRHDTRFQSLWTTHPDGTGTAHYYGSYSSSPCMIADTQPIPGTHKVVSTAMAHHGYTRGSIIVVDVTRGEDGYDPLTVLTPEIAFPEASYDAMTWMLKAPVPVFDSSNNDGLRSRAMATAPYPINDTLFLCSYADKGHGYHTYLIGTMGGRELIYGRDQVSAAIPVLPRKMPRAIPTVLPERPKENAGTLVVQDIYINRHVDEKHPLDRGSIKFLRVNRILTQPARVHWPRGAVANEVNKRPLGTVPVNPDGSVALKAPAGVPLQLQALDENRMAIMTMRSFIYLHPGETVTSVPRDCFSPTSKLPGMLLQGHHGLVLDDDSFERVVTWLDVNSQCYGTYLPNREEQRRPDPAAEAAGSVKWSTKTSTGNNCGQRRPTRHRIAAPSVLSYLTNSPQIC